MADEEDPPPKAVSSSSPPPPQQNQNDNVSNVSINMNLNNNNHRNSTIANSQESVYKNTTFTYQNGDHGSSTLDYRNGKTGNGGKAGMKRYRNEMKHLLPYREAKGSSAHFEDFATQIDYVNCLQFIFFTWMSPLVAKIFSGRFTLEDIQACSPHDSCLQSSRRFKRLWTRQCSNSGLHNASLERTLFRFIRTRFLLSSFFYLICLTTGYLSSTYFLMNLLEEIERSLAPTTDDNLSAFNDGGFRNGTSTSTSSSSYYSFSLPTGAALKWTACLCLCELLRAISYSIMFAVTIRTGVRTVNALSGALYEKILSKRPSSSTSASTSNSNSSSNSSSAALQPTNLFANDLGKVFQLVYMLPLTIGSPIIIVVTVAYTFALIGASSAAVGMVAFLAIFALQAVITRRQAALRDRMMAAADQRISLISGLMRDIRTIKFNGWEKPLQADILHCRRSESLLLIRYQYLQCFSTSLALLTPMLITIINILMHTWLGKELSVSTAFSLVMLNYIAAHGIRSLPNYLREIVNGRVALKRIERFLRLDDQTRYLQFPVKDSNGSPANAIELRDASFSWTPPTTSTSEQEFTSYVPSSSSSSTPLHRSNSGNASSFLLSNINLTVPRRRHLCLYGPVGSGKSALLLSILGQTQLFKGEVRLSSSRLAYVSQTPWLQAASIRENVLFGAPFERRRYYETLLKCQLATDIAGLADGEQTIVGEDGRQLSGGQKMRIALARAVYSDADILLLDDLFSALDGRVVRTIFSGVLNELLASKTVVFVSRHLHLLSEKTMVAMLEGGRVVKVGEHGKMVEGDEEYRKAVDRSKLIGTEKEAIEETVEGETAENTSSLPEENHQEKPNDLVEFVEEDEEDEDEDEDEDNVLFKSNGTLPPPPLKSAGAKDSTASYTSLISLLEKCDQNSFSAAHQMPNSHGDSEEFEDDEEGESRGRALDDPEGRLFRKYSAKYRQKFSSSSEKKKAVNGNGNTPSQNNSKTVSKQVAISGQTYTDYIRASGGWPAFALMLALFAAQTATATFASWWLSYWLNQGGGNSGSRTSESQSLDSATMAAEHRSDLFLQNSSSTPLITLSSPSSSSILANPHLHYYQTVYLVLLFVVVFTSLLMGCTYARIAVRAANALHWATLSKLITSPLAFFDAIALGRILNLFSHNIDELDGQLPVALDGFAQRALLVLGSFLLIVLTLHWLFSLPFLVFGVVFVLIYRHYRSATYWLKQADLRLRSPIYGYLSATVEGLSVVKAFSGAEDRFTRNFFRLADRQAAGHWLSLCTVRWLSIRIDLLCIAANVVVCLLVLVKLRTVGAAYAGLVITQSMQLSGLLQLVVRLALDLETRLVSVERLQAYIRLLRSERSTTMALSAREQQLNFDLLPNTSENSSKLWWPSAGRISFRAVSLRYRANLPLALKNVTFDVPGGSKVAIVGRTGAGKSSITYALFRLVEIASAEKSDENSGIFIDGVDIRAVPLEVLRSRLTIIPQDPVLFTGSSIRKNLDPRGKASEEQLLSVLEAVGLREKVERQCRGGLDEPIAAGSAGSVQQPKSSQHQQRSSGTSGGFSTGEKQLLCLARALLRGSRIIVLDEATSAVDDQMEVAIWRLVRTVFADCTVLLIAHRLQTVLDCDQVIVIRKGEVVESGDPKVLRAEPRSLFAKMVSSQSSQKVLRIKK